MRARSVVLACALAGCGDDQGRPGGGPGISITAADGWVSGEIALEVELDGEADRIELYVDGALVETFPALPEPMLIDTETLGDGVRELWIAAHGPTGVGADAVWLSVDNHAPEITFDAIHGGFTMFFDLVEEGSGVDHGTVTWDGGSTPLVPGPWRAILPGCVVGDVEVEVVDAAGWTETVTVAVQTGLAGDVFADGLDRDCDGIDGTDVDGDGVPATSFGDAPDCDDEDPEVHGTWSGWSTAERVAGVQGGGIWNAFRPVIAGDRIAIAYIDFEGMLWVVRGVLGGAWAEPVAIEYASFWFDDAPAIALEPSGVVHLLWSNAGNLKVGRLGATLQSEVIGADNAAPLGIVVTDDGVVHAFYAASEVIAHAEGGVGRTWSTETLPISIAGGLPTVRIHDGELVVAALQFGGTAPQIARKVGETWEVTAAPTAVNWLGPVAFDGDAPVYTTITSNGLEVWGGRFGAWPGTVLPLSSWYHVALEIGADGRVQVVISDRNTAFASTRWVHDGVAWTREPIAATPRIALDATGKMHGAFFGTVPGFDGPTAIFHTVEGTPIPAAGCDDVVDPFAAP